MVKSDRKAGRTTISISTELLDRAETLASQTGRARDDIIASALSSGLRDEERVQSIFLEHDEHVVVREEEGCVVDVPVIRSFDLDELLGRMKPDTFPEAVEFAPPTGKES